MAFPRSRQFGAPATAVLQTVPARESSNNDQESSGGARLREPGNTGEAGACCEPPAGMKNGVNGADPVSTSAGLASAGLLNNRVQ